MVDNWVLVTGGTGGIGAALVRQLATRGLRPIVGYRSRREHAEELARECHGEALALDLFEFDQIDTVIDRIGDRMVNSVVLNAGPTLHLEKFRNFPSQSFEDQFRCAVIGNHRLLAGVINGNFRQCKTGTVVGVLTSAMGSAKEPAMKNVASYVSAKYGLLGLLKAAASEYSWLRVETVYPPMTDTPMLEIFPPRFVELQRERNALAKPDEIAAEIVAKILGK